MKKHRHSKTFTEDEIKRTFIDTFHCAGEVWFDYLDDEAGNMRATETAWREFRDRLVKTEDGNAAGEKRSLQGQDNEVRREGEARIQGEEESR